MILNEILMDNLKEIAKIKPSGYIEDVIKAATHVEHDRVLLTDEAYRDIRKKYWPVGEIPPEYIPSVDWQKGRCCS